MSPVALILEAGASDATDLAAADGETRRSSGRSGQATPPHSVDLAERDPGGVRDLPGGQSGVPLRQELPPRCLQDRRAGRCGVSQRRLPLRHHFEQNFHVRHRLRRYGADDAMDFERVPPETIAAAIAEELGHEVTYLPVEADGAARAATQIAELL